MTAFQSQPYWALVFAADHTSGLGVTGLLFSAMTVSTRYGGAAVWTAKTLTANDWVELGDGYYYLRFLATELAAVGQLTYLVTNATVKPVHAAFDVDPPPLTFQAAPGTCIVTGNVVDVGGRPGQSTLITVRPAALPAVTGPSLISAELLKVSPDALGNFSVPLIQGATVIFELNPVGIKNQVTVPATSSATLLSLLPPI